MNTPTSSYKAFINKHNEALETNETINLYDYSAIEGIECCLWPHLYPYTDLCETTLKGNESRLSGKIAFLNKVFSNILDYGLTYDLLQFHYDLWIFKTVTGAISSARRMQCSPARALNAKTFSAGYWKTQHRLLVDAVRQFGYPSVFVTINPYEWTFPFPQWLKNAQQLTGCGPTKLAGFETIHIAHTLEQIVRGYLCGSNDARWNKHVFSYNNRKGRSNINTYYYRFEFQKRGTVHLHLLVWLKNIKKIQHQLVRADIPYEDVDVAFLVRKLQPSDRDSLPLNNNPSGFQSTEGVTTLSLYHPHEAFALNLRSYISTVIPTLQYRMDFQTADGRSMLLKYVTSYVSKWKDAYSNDALYSTHTTPYQAAYRHLRDMHATVRTGNVVAINIHEMFMDEQSNEGIRCSSF